MGACLSVSSRLGLRSSGTGNNAVHVTGSSGLRGHAGSCCLQGFQLVLNRKWLQLVGVASRCLSTKSDHCGVNTVLRDSLGRMHRCCREGMHRHQHSLGVTESYLFEEEYYFYHHVR
jgi:hypothetical protein